MRLAELMTEAGLPEGVFNVVHGGAETVDALLKHPDVAAISFVGSTKVAKYIYETATAPANARRPPAGEKYMLVMPDADLDAATNQIIGALSVAAGSGAWPGASRSRWARPATL